MHTESEIRKTIKPLVEFYGELNMSDVKEKISDVLNKSDVGFDFCETIIV